MTQKWRNAVNKIIKGLAKNFKNDLLGGLSEIKKRHLQEANAKKIKLYELDKVRVFEECGRVVLKNANPEISPFVEHFIKTQMFAYYVDIYYSE